MGHRVLVMMGSDSDRPVMQKGVDVLVEAGVDVEVKVFDLGLEFLLLLIGLDPSPDALPNNNSERCREPTAALDPLGKAKEPSASAGIS